MSVPAAVVFVQVAPPESAREHGELLTTACTQGLRQGACVLTGAAPPEPGSAVIAEVEWQDEFRVAAVRVGTPGTDRQQWVTGTVAFDDRDALADRWTTAGFTVATLAGDLVPATPPSEAPAPPPSRGTQSDVRLDAPAAPPPRSSQEAARSRLKLSLGGAVGQAMENEDFRAGPWASVSYAPLRLPAALRLRGGMSFADTAAGSVRWSTLSGGVEIEMPIGASGLDFVAAGEGGANVVSASGASQASRVTGLICLLLALELSIGGPLRAVLGADLSLTPATNLRGADGNTIADRRAKLSGLAGLEVEL